jgi:hypothetical protein
MAIDSLSSRASHVCRLTNARPSGSTSQAPRPPTRSPRAGRDVMVDPGAAGYAVIYRIGRRCPTDRPRERAVHLGHRLHGSGRLLDLAGGRWGNRRALERIRMEDPFHGDGVGSDQRTPLALLWFSPTPALRWETKGVPTKQMTFHPHPLVESWNGRVWAVQAAP